MNYNFFLEKSSKFFLFSSFFAIFIISYVFGIKGFVVTPFLNIFQYCVLFFIILIFLLNNNSSLPRDSLGFGVFIYIFLVLMSLFVGVFNGNSIVYIVAWGGYFIAAALSYIIGYSSVRKEITLDFFSENKIFDNLRFIISIVILLILFRNGFSFILILSILIVNLFFCKGAFLKTLFFLLIILCNLSFSSDGFNFNIARAGLISVLTGIFISFFYMRKSFKIFIFIFFIFISYLFIIFASQEFINSIPSRNLKEGAQLIRGDAIDDHIATAQRFYEANLVIEDYNDANTIEYMFGKGFGRTLDMSQSSDSSVGGAALEGEKEVNNVHFLPFAIFHKMGFLGLTFLLLTFIYLITIFINDVVGGRRSKTLLFCYIYLFSLFFYAAPASNYLIANPYFAMVFGYLVSFRKYRFFLNR